MLAWLLVLTASAHIHLTSPDNRLDDQKTGPCGKAGSRVRAPVETWVAGETVTVVFDETIEHPGWFRIMLDPSGGQDFPIPDAFDDTDAPGGDSLVLWQAEDTERRGHHEVEIVVPDIVCDTCVLQVIQVMTDKAPYGDGNDLYFQCADVEIVANADDTDAGTDDPSDTDPNVDVAVGCACAQATGTSGAAILLLTGPLLLRRRRRG